MWKARLRCSGREGRKEVGDVVLMGIATEHGTRREGGGTQSHHAVLMGETGFQRHQKAYCTSGGGRVDAPAATAAVLTLSRSSSMVWRAISTSDAASVQLR